ncbi:MAG: HTTM domain-containing protein [Candidatus Acidiferrales bacterium]
MTVRGFIRRWNDFFFKPESPTPIALFRILYGLLTITNLFMLRPEWLKWYSPRGFMTMDTMHKMASAPHANFFELLPQTDVASLAFFWGFLIVSIFLTAGFMTRFSTVAVFLCVQSIQARNPYILNGSDTLLSVLAFFMIFAPAGAAFSVDRWRRIRKGVEGREVPLHSPWVLRLIQIQIAFMYFTTFYCKTRGTTWIDGTAVWYALHYVEGHRFAFPIHSLFLIKLLSWGTLVIEICIPLLVWFRELRYPVLIAGLCLHLGIEYAMTIPLFEWISIATYAVFIYPEDLSRAGSWIRSRLGSKLYSLKTYAPVLRRKSAT